MQSAATTARLVRCVWRSLWPPHLPSNCPARTSFTLSASGCGFQSNIRALLAARSCPPALSGRRRRVTVRRDLGKTILYLDQALLFTRPCIHDLPAISKLVHAPICLCMRHRSCRLLATVPRARNVVTECANFAIGPFGLRKSFPGR